MSLRATLTFGTFSDFPLAFKRIYFVLLMFGQPRGRETNYRFPPVTWCTSLRVADILMWRLNAINLQCCGVTVQQVDSESSYVGSSIAVPVMIEDFAISSTTPFAMISLALLLTSREAHRLSF